MAFEQNLVWLVRHHMCCGNVTWVHLHETIMELGILDLWHNCLDSSFSLTAKHNWRKDAALGHPSPSCLFRKSNRGERQISRGTRPRALLRIHGLVSVSCFYQVSLKVSVRKRWPPFSERTHDRHVAFLSGNLNRAITTKQASSTKMQKDQEAGKADASRSPEDRNWRREGQRT